MAAQQLVQQLEFNRKIEQLRNAGGGELADMIKQLRNVLAEKDKYAIWLQSECDKAVDALYKRNREVADALAELEEELKAKAMATVTDGKFSKIGHGINLARIELKATIAKLGLEAQ